MTMSFQEKSLWLIFISLIACFGFYFSMVLPGSARDVMPQQVALFGLAVVVLVLLQIVGHVVIALVDRRTDTDERDRLIGLIGSRNAGYVLATGVFTALSTALLFPGNFLFTHVLLGFWALAQLVETGSQLFLYRKES
ncbi:MAG: hypothetical protein V4631_09380 [Pseudomonadota bacterium]